MGVLTNRPQTDNRPHIITVSYCQPCLGDALSRFRNIAWCKVPLSPQSIGVTELMSALAHLALTFVCPHASIQRNTALPDDNHNPEQCSRSADLHDIHHVCLSHLSSMLKSGKLGKSHFIFEMPRSL